MVGKHSIKSAVGEGKNIFSKLSELSDPLIQNLPASVSAAIGRYFPFIKYTQVTWGWGERFLHHGHVWSPASFSGIISTRERGWEDRPAFPVSVAGAVSGFLPATQRTCFGHIHVLRQRKVRIWPMPAHRAPSVTEQKPLLNQPRHGSCSGRVPCHRGKSD